MIIDAPFDDFVAQYQVPVYTAETGDKMANAEEPFNDIGLFLITHEHRGHFDYELLGQCFTNNPNAILVTTPGVYDILEAQIANFAEFEDRIFAPELDFYVSFDTTISEIPLRMVKAEHWGGVDLFNFDFNLEGMEIAFVLEEENYENNEEIDLLFADSLASPLEPKHIILCHQSGTANIADLLEQSLALPDVTFLTESMETATFSKEGDEIIVTIP